MRSIQVLLLGAIFVFVVCFLFTTEAGEKPDDEAKTFLTKVAQNDVPGALAEFGDNTCHCAPKGGYAAYLHGYSAAQEPNITFLLGQKDITFGPPRVKELPYNGTPYILPWDRPEDAVVYLPVEFKDPDKRPFFLPLDSAFGYKINERDLMIFERGPEDWSKAMTLRLRSSLAPGTVPPKGEKEPESELEKAAREGLLPKELAKYVRPSDPGMVQTFSGAEVPLSKFEKQLPRLKSCEVGLKVVRRGSFKRWAIKKLGVVNCVLVTASGKEMKIATNDQQTENEEPSGTPVTTTGQSTDKKKEAP